MKEEDLKKHLDNILIYGLIKEAEQDNADFEAAMRNLSDSSFDAIVGEDSQEYKKKEEKPNFSRWKVLRPWIVSLTSAAAVILIVLIPSINSMNARLCDGAIYMSQDYISASKGGFNPSSATNEQIKDALPSLENRYEELIRNGTYEQIDFQETAWDLAIAYLKLHKKSDAIKVLKTLESHRRNTPMGDHCKKLLEQLD